MTLFEGEQNGRYETDHLHMVLNEHIDFTEEGLSDDRKYSIFVHEYVHYYQHFATLYGSQFCKMANLLFIETRAFLEGADKVVIPFGIWEHNEGISYDCPNLDDTTKSEISRRLGDKVFGGSLGHLKKRVDVTC